MTPRISIVIPAYNSAEFLSAAIDSALAQTVANCEVIVVNDGSTDNTPDVLAQYEDQIRIIDQANRGLSGARNSGIRAATGELIGLLDADDIWLPTFCETLLQLVERNPDAAAYYGAVQCMSAEGVDLPQAGGQKVVATDQFYTHLVRANWLIPSSMLLRRDIIIDAGLFDPAIRAAEDWDLWLRIGQEHPFAGTEQIVARYRLHGASLSADPAKMHLAVRQVIEKNFGLESADIEAWPYFKRIGYGGLYRYCAVTSLLRLNDWAAATDHLRKAIRIDPDLAQDIDLFYEFALGDQALGERGHVVLKGISAERNMRKLIDALCDDPLLAPLNNAINTTATFALALAIYNSGQRRESRPHLWRTLRTAPQYRKRATKLLLRSLI